ncbi:MAG TPA: type I DNA topoisomerase [Dehalococcoidia bacterium]|nr:type I DNA topoisomerase [Dehalococcoidia bacterium]
MTSRKKKKNLVIVESPAKARTLGKILGSDYELKASLGHVRDLPRSSLGVDIENGFTPKYVVPRPKSKTVKELKDAAKDVANVYLATDPDREGEAISWHLVSVMKPSTRFRRVVFHEITEEAIEHAFKHPRDIDMHLVNAQQARRILDRLVGYRISPLLWKKVRRGLSAGRVQSAALRIIVDREREIENFIPVEYWNIEAELAKKAAAKEDAFRAMLVGFLDGTKIELNSEDETNKLVSKLEQSSYTVHKTKTKKATRQPAPPFITSTLQQEAYYKLRFSARQTMSLAQQLYEGLPLGKEGSVGLITYMRTDSTQVARSAVVEARAYINEKYGVDYVPPHARSFTRKVKGAQEAHEAIRPTRIRREPSLVKPHLTANQFKLYELIWKRMVASQMAAAIFDNTSVDIQAECRQSRTDYLLRAFCSVNRFPGFTVLYTVEREQDEEEAVKSSPLPGLKKGDNLNLLGLFPEQRFTQPPPRFTEASLIRTLEQYGIGRPSTYAPILSTIQQREYVSRDRSILQPTELGMVVSDLMSEHFPDIVDIAFTARLEDELDEIANDKGDWVEVVQTFYTPLEKSLTAATEQIEKVKLADELTDETCPNCGRQLAIKTGRFGKFLACTGYPDCKYTRSYQLKTGAICPQCGGDLVERRSKKGRTFYGCSNYPACNFAVFSRPLPEPCPRCGALMTEYRGNQARCTKCSYRGRIPQDTVHATSPG